MKLCVCVCVCARACMPASSHLMLQFLNSKIHCFGITLFVLFQTFGIAHLCTFLVMLHKLYGDGPTQWLKHVTIERNENKRYLIYRLRYLLHL